MLCFFVMTLLGLCLTQVCYLLKFSKIAIKKLGSKWLSIIKKYFEIQFRRCNGRLSFSPVQNSLTLFSGPVVWIEYHCWFQFPWFHTKHWLQKWPCDSGHPESFYSLPLASLIGSGWTCDPIRPMKGAFVLLWELSGKHFHESCY